MRGNYNVLLCSFFYRGGPNLLSRFKQKMHDIYKTDDIEKLRLFGVFLELMIYNNISCRFVWRSRQGVGYFVFREIRSGENILSTMKDMPYALTGSLLVRRKQAYLWQFPLKVCVNDMDNGEMDDMEKDEIIVPLVHIYTKNVKQFNNNESTVFIKVMCVVHT